MSSPSEISFNVAGPPLSQNRAWEIVIIPVKGGGRGHASLKLTDEGRNFKHEVARLSSLVKPRGWDRDNEYVVECRYYFKTTASDVDGPGKLVLDAMQDLDLDVGRGRSVRFEGLYRRDSQVWRFIQTKEKDPERPRTEITVRLRRPSQPEQKALL